MMLGLDRHWDRLARRHYDECDASDAIDRELEKARLEHETELERVEMRYETLRRSSLRRILRLARYRYAVEACSTSGSERDRLLRWCQWCKKLEARI